MEIEQPGGGQSLIVKGGATTVLNVSEIDFTGATVVDSGGGVVTVTITGSGVTSVSGTANRITSTGGNTPIIDIAATYVGQASLTTLGTIATGVWQGTKIGLAYGGTNADLSATGGTSQVLKQSTAGATITVGQLSVSDIGSGAALTKVDDTNVTLTLGGTPTAALLATTSLTLGWTGNLSVSRGGTGNTTLTAYAPLFGGTTTTNPIQSGTVGSSGQSLISNGAGALATFQDIPQINLSPSVSNTVQAAFSAVAVKRYTIGSVLRLTVNSGSYFAII